MIDNYFSQILSNETLFETLKEIKENFQSELPEEESFFLSQLLKDFESFTSKCHEDPDVASKLQSYHIKKGQFLQFAQMLDEPVTITLNKKQCEKIPDRELRG